MGFGSPSLTIFASMPPPDQATFNAGLPAASDGNTALAVILFSPNLQNLIVLDNTDSDASSHWEKDVTYGFSFSSTQGFSISNTVGVNIEVATDTVTTQFSISFTEQWSTQTTEKMSFDCPGRKKAFVYQGTLMSRLLKYDAGSGVFSWSGAAETTPTTVIKTTATALLVPDPNAHIVPG